MRQSLSVTTQNEFRETTEKRRNDETFFVRFKPNRTALRESNLGL